MKKYLWILLLVPVILLGLFYFKFFYHPQGSYQEGIARLGMNSTAHLMCSCLFVSENEEGFCRDYAKLKQVSPQITIDRGSKSVEARLFGIFSGQAQFVSSESGCKLL